MKSLLLLICLTICQLAPAVDDKIIDLQINRNRILKCRPIKSRESGWFFKKPKSASFEKLTEKRQKRENLIIQKEKFNFKRLKIKKEFSRLSLNGTIIEFRQVKRTGNQVWRTVCRYIIRIGEKCNDGNKSLCLTWFYPHTSISYQACSTVNISCIFKNNHNRIVSNLTWFYNSKRIDVTKEKTHQPYCDTMRYSTTGNQLSISNVESEHTGNFTCQATDNFNRTASRDFYIKVTPPLHVQPVIIEKPSNKTVFLGQNVTNHCKANMNGRVYWKKYDNITKEFKLLGSAERRKFRQQNKSTILVVFNFSAEEDADYLCTTASKGNPPSRTVYFRLKLASEAKDVQHKSLNTWKIIVISICCIVFAIIIVCSTVFYIWHMDKKMRRCHKKLIVMKPNENYAFNEYSTSSPLDNIQVGLVPMEDDGRVHHIYGNTIAQLPEDEPFFYEWKDMDLGNLIGQGAFGQVFKADLSQLHGSIPVAVKKLRENATDRDVIDMWKEFERMKTIGSHINIISLVGYTTFEGNMYLITEYAEHGNLQLYLRRHSPPAGSDGILDYKDLVHLAWQIARGMEYLSNRQCIHRDLAARNVLVASNRVAKIADFGLSRDLTETEYYRLRPGGRIPIKWVPPETLFDFKFTIMSDVWAYGVVLWEIFSYGAEPYEDHEPAALFVLLNDGYRMPKADYMSEEIAEIMTMCWREDPITRPYFSTISTITDKIIERLVTYGSYMEERSVEEESDELTQLLSRSATDTKSPRASSSDSQYSSMPDEQLKDGFDHFLPETDV